MVQNLIYEPCNPRNFILGVLQHNDCGRGAKPLNNLPISWEQKHEIILHKVGIFATYQQRENKNSLHSMLMLYRIALATF